jgi:hypothetical protein
MNRYDAICGIPAPFTTTDGLEIPCRRDLNHQGDHDWRQYLYCVRIFCGITRSEVVQRAINGSAAARAMLGVPYECTCELSRSVEGIGVERALDPACRVHGNGSTKSHGLAEAENGEHA